MNQKLVSIITLGCKLNYSESSTLRRIFEENGYTYTDEIENAAVVVINTCTVTSMASKKSRHAIHQSLHKNPEAFVVAVGCYSEINPEEIKNIDGVDLILGSNSKFEIVEQIEKAISQNETIIHCDNKSSHKQFYPSWSLNDRTRSFLKVQDGCDYNCSYCTIPKARGKSRNAKISEIVKQAENIAKTGVKEIVLTGVNTGDFGKSTNETFINLIKELEKINFDIRFRISSLEPDLFSEEMIDFLSESKKFVNHFHIPLQSGNDRILALMRRRYKREIFEKLVKIIKSKFHDACIGTDIITAFPSETDEEFYDTFHFLENLPISYLHVFPFSYRKGTFAAEIKNNIQPSEIENRSKILHELSLKKRSVFYHENLNKTVNVLFEEKHRNNTISGFSENYIRVEVAECKDYINRIIRVKLTGFSKTGNMTGEIV